jgi:hypothetical protein
MSIFVIFRVARPAELEAALARVYPDDYLSLGGGQYLVSAIGSAKAVSDKLGISDGNMGSAIVFKMTNYFGRATTEIWDWVKNKAEGASE